MRDPPESRGGPWGGEASHYCNGCWMLDVGCWLDSPQARVLAKSGCWMLDVGCWLDSPQARVFTNIQDPTSNIRRFVTTLVSGSRSAGCSAPLRSSGRP